LVMSYVKLKEGFESCHTCEYCDVFM